MMHRSMNMKLIENTLLLPRCGLEDCQELLSSASYPDRFWKPLAWVCRISSSGGKFPWAWS